MGQIVAKKQPRPSLMVECQEAVDESKAMIEVRLAEIRANEKEHASLLVDLARWREGLEEDVAMLEQVQCLEAN